MEKEFKYFRKKVKFDIRSGIVCGHDPSNEERLIIAVTEGEEGWHETSLPHVFLGYENNQKGYWWVESKYIIN